MSKKTSKKSSVSKYGVCQCTACGQNATSAKINAIHASCPGEKLPAMFDPSLQGRLVLRGMQIVGTWKLKSEIERELADVNSRIAAYTLRDDQAAIDSDVLRNQGYQRALAELGTADKCVVTPAMVKAFTRIVP